MASKNTSCFLGEKNVPRVRSLTKANFFWLRKFTADGNLVKIMAT